MAGFPPFPTYASCSLLSPSVAVTESGGRNNGVFLLPFVPFFYGVHNTEHSADEICTHFFLNMTLSHRKEASFSYWLLLLKLLRLEEHQRFCGDFISKILWTG